METMETDVVQRAESKLSETEGGHLLLIPLEIEAAAKTNPGIICNRLTPHMAEALLECLQVKGVKRKYLSPTYLAHFGGLFNDDLRKHIRSISKGDTLIIHHIHGNSEYYTTIANFNYVFDDGIHLEAEMPKRRSLTIEGNNLVAVLRVPTGLSLKHRNTVDNQHKLFVRTTLRLK